MSYVPITLAEILSGRGIRSSLYLKYRSNDEWLKAQWEAGEPMGELLWNGSFELDADGEPQPLGWVFSPYPGGAGEVETGVNAAHGAKCFKVIQVAGASQGGGVLMSDLVPVSSLKQYTLSFLVHCATGGTTGRVKVSILHCDGAGKPMGLYSPSVLWDGFAPVSSTRYVRGFMPVPGAKYIRIAFSVAEPQYAGNDTIYIDNVSLRDISVMDARGTIAEDSTSSTSWVDKGSAALTIPNVGRGYALIILEAQCRVGTSGTAYMRFRIGENYSNEIVTTVNTYQAYRFLLRAELTDSAALTLVMQLKIDSGTSYGKKATAKTGLVLLP